MNGAKVNGKLVSLDTKLRNGDQVEIMRRDSAHPTKKWLAFAKTSLARRHIRMRIGTVEADIAAALAPTKKVKEKKQLRAKKEKIPKTP